MKKIFKCAVAAAAAVVTTTAVLAPTTAQADTVPAGTVLLFDGFNYPNGLVTNEYAHWSGTKLDAVHSPTWDMTSGSLFAVNGEGYSGKVDNISPDALSVRGTNSAVFRLNTKRFDFGDTRTTFRLKVDGLYSTSSTPQVAWDGIHIFLRYQSEESLYYASVARRDGSIVIKKKCVGGPSNGGTYYTLGSKSGYRIPAGQWLTVSGSVRNTYDGGVQMWLSHNGTPLLSVTDHGTGCAPITNPGATGIRADNAQFRFDGFTVATL
jgi:hypothetical protein